MVPKPTPEEWRFYLDFVRLNDYTSDLEGWAITVIRDRCSKDSALVNLSTLLR